MRDTDPFEHPNYQFLEIIDMNPVQSICNPLASCEEPEQQKANSSHENSDEPNPAITSEVAAPRKNPAKKSRSWVTWFSMAFVILIGAQALLFVACASAYFWLETKSDEVKSATPAGHVLRSDQTTSLFSRGVVETDAGYFFLISPMSVRKGDLLSLEVRGNGDRYLCDSHRFCTKLL